jgi:hypothetical protein
MSLDFRTELKRNMAARRRRALLSRQRLKHGFWSKNAMSMARSETLELGQRTLNGFSRAQVLACRP